jgi:hypothetical protein
MVEMEMQIYNVEGLGPVVSLSAIRPILQDLADRGFDDRRLKRTIRMLGEIADMAARETLVRLGPSVPGVLPAPFLATVPVGMDPIA